MQLRTICPVKIIHIDEKRTPPPPNPPAKKKGPQSYETYKYKH